MFDRHRGKLVVTAVAALAVVAAAGAIAATGALSPRQESQAVVNDAARRLGVQPSELSAALKAALKARVDAAVEAGRLTEAQGNELKQRIDANEVPLFGLGPGGPRGHHHRHVHFHSLDTAASYLGLSEDALRSQLMEGRTLAQIARARDKSVDGLVDAMVNAARQELDRAVRDGRVTEAQRDRIAANLRERVTDKVNGRLRGPGGRRFHRWFGPPPELAPAPEPETSAF
jgi:hypothetical protein